jgi:hypothetical protein
MPFSPLRPNWLLCAKLSERTEPVLEVIGASDLAISDGPDIDRHDPKASARMRHTEKIASRCSLTSPRTMTRSPATRTSLMSNFMSGMDLAKPPTTLIEASRP